MAAWWAWALAGLAALGFVNALYFTLVTYRWVRPDSPWLPRVCRMDEDTCARIVDTRYARVFGLPNSVYGMAWYAVVLAVALRPELLAAPLAPPALLAASGFTVALSAYLGWALLRRLRVVCALCFLGYAINAALLAVLASAPLV